MFQEDRSAKNSEDDVKEAQSRKVFIGIDDAVQH